MIYVYGVRFTDKIKITLFISSIINFLLIIILIICAESYLFVIVYFLVYYLTFLFFLSPILLLFTSGVLAVIKYDYRDMREAHDGERLHTIGKGYHFIKRYKSIGTTVDLDTVSFDKKYFEKGKEIVWGSTPRGKLLVAPKGVFDELYYYKNIGRKCYGRGGEFQYTFNNNHCVKSYSEFEKTYLSLNERKIQRGIMLYLKVHHIHGSNLILVNDFCDTKIENITECAIGGMLLFAQNKIKINELEIKCGDENMERDFERRCGRVMVEERRSIYKSALRKLNKDIENNRKKSHEKVKYYELSPNHEKYKYGSERRKKNQERVRSSVSMNIAIRDGEFSDKLLDRMRFHGIKNLKSEEALMRNGDLIPEEFLRITFVDGIRADVGINLMELVNSDLPIS